MKVLSAIAVLFADVAVSLLLFVLATFGVQYFFDAVGVLNVPLLEGSGFVLVMTPFYWYAKWRGVIDLDRWDVVALVLGTVIMMPVIGPVLAVPFHLGPFLLGPVMAAVFCIVSWLRNRSLPPRRPGTFVEGVFDTRDPISRTS